MLNVNIPDVNCATAIKGRKITRLGHSHIACPVHPVTDPRGRDAYWLSLRKGEFSGHKKDNQAINTISATSATKVERLDADIINETDVQAVAAGYISISPVRVHHTPTAALNQLSALVS